MKSLSGRQKFCSAKFVFSKVIYQARRTNVFSMMITICIILFSFILIDVYTRRLSYSSEPKALEQAFIPLKPDAYTQLVRDNVQYYINERWIPSVHAKFAVLPVERLALCQSETSATATLLNFFCYSRYIRSTRNETLENFFKNVCFGKVGMLVSADIFLEMSTGVNILFLIEEPFRRFARAFRKLCVESTTLSPNVCFGCGSDIACVINNLPTALKKWNDGAENNSMNSIEKVHFSPQSWNCGLMNNYEMTTFVRLRDIDDGQAIPRQVKNILVSTGVNASMIDEFNKQVKDSFARTSVTEKNIIYILFSAKDLKNKLKQIYRDDFELFHSTV